VSASRMTPTTMRTENANSFEVGRTSDRAKKAHKEVEKGELERASTSRVSSRERSAERELKRKARFVRSPRTLEGLR